MSAKRMVWTDGQMDRDRDSDRDRDRARGKDKGKDKDKGSPTKLAWSVCARQSYPTISLGQSSRQQ